MLSAHSGSIIMFPLVSGGREEVPLQEPCFFIYYLSVQIMLVFNTDKIAQMVSSSKLQLEILFQLFYYKDQGFGAKDFGLADLGARHSDRNLLSAEDIHL